MIITEFALDHPIFRDTLRRIPEIELTWEQSYRTQDDRMQIIFWAEHGDFEEFEAAIRTDPSVTDPVVIAEVGERRLYRVDLTDVGKATSIMPLLVDLGAMPQQLTATHEGWRNRVRFPTREAFEQVYRFCGDHDIDFVFHNLYERAERWDEDSSRLTDVQHETLIKAVETGYLDIPRRCSLAELGETLGISESAASERFRRGVKNLVEETISQ